MNYALVTVDVEAHFGDRPVDRYIWGKIGQDRCGLERLVELFDSLGIKALFFVDFAECWDYGDDAIREATDYIQSKGHAVGIHIHPDHMRDEKKQFLWEYDSSDQKEMIDLVIEKYRSFCGSEPVFFRAGKYGINWSTLNILEESAVKVDFSQFFGNAWCQVSPTCTADATCNLGDLLEVPVTSFSVLGRKFDKCDLEMSPTTLKYVIKQFNKVNDNQIVSLFAHSFSFVENRFDRSSQTLRCSFGMPKRFIQSLQFVKEFEGLELITPDELMEIHRKGGFRENRPNEYPTVEITNAAMAVQYAFSTAWRIRKENRKARYLLAALAAGLLGVLLGVIVLLGASIC